MTMTVDMDSSAGTATVPSSGQITTPRQTAATTLSFPTKGKLPAGTMVGNMNMGKLSRLMMAATTVSVSQEKLSALKRPVMEVISASVKLSVERILEASVFSRSYLTEYGTLTAPVRGQTMARHGAQPRSTTRGITSVARGTGATALPLAVALAMVEGGGAPGHHGALALLPVEEARGAVQGAALVEAVQDQPQKLSSVTCRAAVIVVPGAYGAGAKGDVEGWEVRAGADRADRETVKERKPDPAQPRAAPPRLAEIAPG